MKVAFVYDKANADGTAGGAEYAMAEFAAGHDLVDVDDAETVVIGNCVTVGPQIIPRLEGKRVWRFHHDLARHEDARLREWLDRNAEHIFTSPLHLSRYEIRWDRRERETHLIPPITDLADFKPNRQARRHPDREGTVTVGAWQNPGKGGRLIANTCERNGVELDCYGTGAFAPDGPHVVHMGEVDRGDLPGILRGYEQFVFTPLAPEPFGRCVAEAWAAGCDVLANDLVGAKWWIENDPDALFTAAEDFWELICQK